MQNRVPRKPAERPPLPDFHPVPRKHRHDGWPPQRQRAFIEALANTESVKHAAKAVNMSPEGATAQRVREELARVRERLINEEAAEDADYEEFERWWEARDEERAVNLPSDGVEGGPAES